MEDRNKHHVWWERKDYRKRYERDFRNYSGFVLPKTLVTVHDYLHAVTPVPEKPYRDEMAQILNLCEERRSWDSDNPYYAMEATMSYYVGREVESPNDAEHCRAIRFSLAKQIGILANEHTFDNPITTRNRVL